MSNKAQGGSRIRRDSSVEDVCTLCYHETGGVWVVSPCDHRMCLTCAARLRVLCDMKECPVCRENNEKVVVVEKNKPPAFASVSRLKMIVDKRYGFLFEKRSLINTFEALKTIYCSICGDHQRFSNMKHYQDHLRREHQLSMCDICLAHLKLFPHEHKLYTREQLARHRREGDPDDSAHKGHPLCQFCEERFLDKDSLFFHLKNKHFWCHFCEADGKQDYYANYSELRAHFRSAHFLCSEGTCRYEKFTSVFRTKLDLQAHRAREHSKGLTKAEAKQLRHVDVGFVYSREDVTSDGMPPVSQRQYHGAAAVGTRKRQGNIVSSKEMEDVETAKALSVIDQKKESSSSSEEYSPDPEATSGDTHPLSGSTLVTKKPSPVNTPTVAAMVTAPTIPLQEKQKPDDWPSLDSEQIKQAEPPPVPPGFKPPPPPGFAAAVGDKQQTKVNPPKVPEKDVLEIAKEILNHDKVKIGNFRNYSGLYQRGAMPVGDYYQHCSLLFGSQWKSFGVKLADTLPDPLKRQELRSQFHFTVHEPENPYTLKQQRPPPGLTRGPLVTSAAVVANKKTVNQTSGPWSKKSVKVNFDDDEFPSLQKASKMPDPVPGPPAWNIKVAVK